MRLLRVLAVCGSLVLHLRCCFRARLCTLLCLAIDDMLGLRLGLGLGCAIALSSYGCAYMLLLIVWSDVASRLAVFVVADLGRNPGRRGHSWPQLT